MKKIPQMSFQSPPKRLFRAMALAGLIGIIFFGIRCSDRNENSEIGSEPKIEPEKIIGLGRVEPEPRIVPLAAEISGIVTDILVRPGEKVNEGEVIIRLEDRIEQARLEQAKSQIPVQRSRIESARAALDAAKARLFSTKNNYTRLKKLAESEARARSTFEQAQAEYDSLVADINRLESNVATSRYQLDQLQSELRLAEAQLSLKTICAPAKGLLLSVDIPAGSYVSAGETVGSFAPEGPLTVRCEIDELFANRIKTGQKAYIRQPGQSENQGEGRVSFAGPWLRKKSIFSDDIGDLEDRRVREVHIRLDPGTNILLGSRVECAIILD